MTIKDCILTAIRYLDLKDLEDGIVNEYADVSPWLSMTRDVVAEICSDYYPLKATENVIADKDGLISLYLLSRPVIDVFSVTRGGSNMYKGTSVPFTVKYDRLDVGFSGECCVEYSFMPDLSALSCELPFTDRLDARVIGYGIAAEYCLLNNPEYTAVFDKRYKDALKKAAMPKSERRIKKRSWL